VLAGLGWGISQCIGEFPTPLGDRLVVAHHAAHKMVDSIDVEDHGAMREDLAAELLDLAGGEDP